MKNLTIRDYREGDFGGIRELWKLTGLDDPRREDDEAAILRSLETGGRFLVLEKKGHGIVGTSWLSFDGRRLYLHHLGIHPDHQNTGLGKLLTLESLKIARHKGFQVKLEVHRDNIPALSLYEKLGFQKLDDYEVYILRDIKNFPG